MSDLLADEDVEVLNRLSPKAKEEVYRRVQARTSDDRRIWFCRLGRTCDGKPHEGADYPHARADQYPPPGVDWMVWALRGGRGSGKTRTGAEYIRQAAKSVPWIALIGPTGPAARDVMVEGESGLVEVCARAGEPCQYQPALRRITFQSGARAALFSAEEPDRLRGPQHGVFWADEPAHWPNVEDVWDMLMFGLRLGKRPHGVITTTPRTISWMQEVLDDPLTRSVQMSTYANIDNLAPSFAKAILSRYEGTRLGRQEIYGELIPDVDGALWQTEDFDYNALDTGDCDRVVVAVDPSGSKNKRSDETGIVVAGWTGDSDEGHLHVLADYTGKFTPGGWAAKAIYAYEHHHADAIVVERNFGGDMVRENLKTAGFQGRIVEARATDGKRLRAEPISALYERGRAHHARGLDKLEKEQVSWVPGEGKSPNRVDALVWAATELKRVKRKATYGDPSKVRLEAPNSRIGARMGVQIPSLDRFRRLGGLR